MQLKMHIQCLLSENIIELCLIWYILLDRFIVKLYGKDVEQCVVWKICIRPKAQLLPHQISAQDVKYGSVMGIGHLDIAAILNGVDSKSYL